MDIVNVLKAFSDETRLRIINLIYERELCVCDITETLQITQTKASRHLTYLKNAGLVKDRRHAQWVYYSLQEKDMYSFAILLINDVLRNDDLYKEDLVNLENWLKKKDKTC